MTPIYFAIPGNINALTGGYGYDRRLMHELRQSGFEVIHLPLSATFPVPDAQALQQADNTLANLPSGSVVIVDGLALGVMDSIALQHKSRITIIALCHHPLMFETGLSSADAQKLYESEKRALDAASVILVTSDTTCKILIEQFEISAHKITVVKPGNDKQMPASCIGDPPILLTAASLTQRKGHDVLINALAKLSAYPWTARFVGGDHFDTNWANHLRQLVIAHDLEERILFVGSIADSTDEFSAADIFVLPSHFEGYGMVFSEALSFGLPVIATRAGAIPDVVPDSAGILVTPGDTQELANALEKLLQDPALRKQLQRGALAAATTLPDWADTAKIVSNVLLPFLTTSESLEK